MANHTKGQWVFDPGDSGDPSVGLRPTPPTIVCEPDDGGDIFPICTLDDPVRNADREPTDEFDDCTEGNGDIGSNGRLIEAAPIMLARLREIEAYLEEACDFGVLDRHPAYRLWITVMDAIRKAEGRN